MKCKKYFFLSLSLLILLIFSVVSAYSSNTQKASPVIELEFDSPKNIIEIQNKDTISFPQTIYLNVLENDTKIQIDAYADGKSKRTLELISPNGTVERKYIFNEDKFFEGSNKECMTSGKCQIMVSDIAECGMWTIKISADKDNVEKTSLSAKLISSKLYSFSNDKHSLADGENELFPIKDQIYDYYKTYDEAHLDIENGYIFNMNKSFSIKAMPTVTTNSKKQFYVHHDNTLDIKISLNNLIAGTDNIFAPDSFVSFDIFNPSGKRVYSFYKGGKEIQDSTEITAEIPLYAGEWEYSVSFAYITDGIKTSNIVVAAKFRDLYSEDIDWLIDNKLNKLTYK